MGGYYLSIHNAFLSTLPVRGATETLAYSVDLYAISIHAPREGSDFVCLVNVCGVGISIHAPREGSDLSWMVLPPC